jgi:hypothetical protein
VRQIHPPSSFQFALTAATLTFSLCIFSSCRPWLSSHGDTRSPYKPAEQKQSSQPHGTNGSPLPGNSGTNGAIAPTSPHDSPKPSRPFGKESLAIADGKLLKISLNEEFTLRSTAPNTPDFDASNCRSLVLQQGKLYTSPDSSHFYCVIHYCLNRRGNDPLLVIKKSTAYQFRRTQWQDPTSDDAGYVRFQWIDGDSSMGKIDQLSCTANSDDLTVNSLIDAFGKSGSPEQDVIDVQIVDPPNPKTTRKTASIIDTAEIAPPPARPALKSKSNPAVPTPPPVSMPGKASMMDAPGTHSAPSALSQAKSALPEAFDEKIDLPNLALQLSGTPRAFGGSTISPAQQGVRSGAFLLQLEYQPDFLQHFGIVSFGPSFGTYPTLGTTQNNKKVTSSFFSLTEVGGQARYQFRYFNEQFLVPYVTYEAQSLGYRINDGGSGRLTLAGGSAGLSLLLNTFAPAEGNDFYRNLGVSRSYFIVEGKYLSGSDENVQASGTSVYFGLRFER